MKRKPVRKAKKAVTKVSKKAASKAKKVGKMAKKKASKVKAKSRNLLGKASKRIKSLKRRSTKTWQHAKDKAYATEEDILDYVKENPVKSLSAVALAGLIAGFLSRHSK